MPEIQQLCLSLEAYFILLAATLLPALVLWRDYVRPRPLLPPQRQRLVPWTGFEVSLICFFVLLFWPALVDEILSHSGSLGRLHGSGLNAAPDTDVSRDRQTLWMSVLAWPLQVGTVLLLLRGLSNARAYQIGLSSHDIARNLLLGWLGWALIAPVVLCCHIAAEWVFRTAWGHSPEEHPLLRIFEASPLRVEWIAIIVAATVLAPVLEELLFRGVLQPWLASREWGGTFALLASLVCAVLLRGNKLVEAWQHPGHQGFLRESMPALFVLAMIPGCLALEQAMRRKLVGRQQLRAIYGTSLLFAMFHTAVWPTPIPLFLLALGLGYLAYRTQSVVGPIVMHVLFNGVACIVLFIM